MEDMPNIPEFINMVGATKGALVRGVWNSAKGTYDGVKMLVTEPEKVLEVASDAILDFMEDPWESTKEFVGNIRDDVVDAVWRSTPQEISEDAGEILGDVLTGIATGGGGKAAAGGAKMAGNKLLALGKTGAKEFAEGLGDLGKIGAKNVAYVGATTGMENASKNAFRNRLMMMASETGDKAKKVTGIAEGATSKVDDIATIAGKTGSVANNVTSTTGELIENAVIGTPIVEGSKKAGKIVKDEVVDNAENKIEKKVTQETVENKVVRGESGKGKGDGVQTSSAVNKSQVNNITSTTTNTTINNTVTNGVQTVQYGQHFEKVDKKKVLKANVKYTDSNGYTYITDSQRRITSAEGTLKLQKGTRNQYSQKTVGGTDRLNIDDGGHLFGTQFNGSGEIDNLLPQNKYVNRSGGEWYNMEKKWAKALEEGKKVEVKIDIVYNNNSIRPSDYLVSYKIDGVEYFKNIENFNFRPQKE